MRIQHPIAIADGVAMPVPGLLVGGPQPGQQDVRECKHAYASSLPALSCLDQECSYASNEVAINWNAPLVYVSAGLQNLQHELALAAGSVFLCWMALAGAAPPDMAHDASALAERPAKAR